MKTKPEMQSLELRRAILVVLVVTLLLPRISSAKAGVGDVRIRHITSTGFNINQKFFLIRVSCNEDFVIKSVYAQLNDPDGTIDISYAIAPSPILMVGFLPGGTSGIAFIKGQLFNPAAGVGSTQGYELLSHFEVGQDIGVPANGRLSITGEVVSTSNSSNDTISVGAIVEVLEGATCGISFLLQGGFQ